MNTTLPFTALLAVSALGVLRLSQAGTPDPSATPEAKHHSGKVEVATFAGGCFWGIQDKFDRIPGVLNTTAGYTGGTLKNPTYEDVCSHTTGHAEAVKVEFDPDAVSYGKLLDAFWKMHNPTEKNRQGPDVGDNYRSSIFYHSPEQKTAAERSKEKLDAERYHGTIVTEIVLATEFYPAEEYHQHYFKKKGVLYPVCH